MTIGEYLLGISGSVIASLLYDAAKGTYRKLNQALYDAAVATSAHFSKELGIEFDAAAFLEFLNGDVSSEQIAPFQSGHSTIDDNRLALEFSKLGHVYFDDPEVEVTVARKILAEFKQRFETLLIADPETAAPLFMAYIRAILKESTSSRDVFLEKLRSIEERLSSWPEPLLETLFRKAELEKRSYDSQLHELAEVTGSSFQLLKSQVDDWITKVTSPYQRGLAAQWKRNFSEASRLMKLSIAEAERKLSEAYLSLGTCQFVGIERNEGEQSLLRSIELNESDSSSHAMLAMLYMQSGRANEAQQSLDKALSLNRSSKVLNLQGLFLQSIGKPSQAITSFQMALEMDPDDQSVRMNLAQCWIDVGSLDKAQAAFDAVTSAANVPPGAWSKYADLHIKRGNDQKARECFEKAIDLHPWEPAAYNNFANFLVENGDLEGAVSKFEQAIVIEPRYANAVFNLGLCFDRLGDSTKAVREFKRVLEISPESSLTGQPRHTEAAVQIARIRIEEGEFEDGISYCDLALEYDDGCADALGLKGLACKRQGQLLRAKQLYREGLEKEPGNSLIRYNLACIHALEGDRKAAMRELQLAVNADEDLKENAKVDKDFKRFWHYKDFLSITR